MKKYCTIISFMLAVTIIFASISIASVNAANQLGDPDGDGKICNPKDILCIKNYLAKNGNNSSDVQILKADVYPDNVIDSKDLLVMRMYAADIIKSVPYEAKTSASTSVTQAVDPSQYPQDTAVLKRMISIDSNLYLSALVNQAGYSTNAKKVVKLTETMVSANSMRTNSFVANKLCRVYKIDGGQKTQVGDFTSSSRKNFNNELVEYGAMYVSELDITSIKTPGKYLVSTPFGCSFEFEIRNNSSERAMNDALMALYYNRCGGDISATTLREYDTYLAENFGITAGSYYNKYKIYERDACHLVSKGSNKGKEVAIVDTYNSATDTFVLNKDGSNNILYYPATDFGYGLHDAGDYGRYTQPAAQVVDDLLYAYEMYPQASASLNVIHDEGTIDLPDILDLARWEAKFLLNMQNKGRTGENASSKGGFYYKICTAKFASDTGSKPENDAGFNGTNGSYPGLRVQQVNMASTASAVGALAACYNIFKNKDPGFANECLAAAKSGYQYYINHISDGSAESAARNMKASSKSEDDVGGGEYGGDASEASATFFFASAALYRATGEATYNEQAKAKASGNYSGFATQNQGGYGNLAYYLAYAKDGISGADETTANACLKVIKGIAVNNGNKAVTDSPLDAVENCFAAWGSNGAMASILKVNSFVSAISNYTNDTTDYITANRLCEGFMLGQNPLGYCMLTGMGLGKSASKVTSNIHHYPSVLFTSGGDPCQPGWLAEGYSKHSRSAGKYAASDSGRFRYRDDNSDFVTNEVVVYGNSAFVFMLASVVQQDNEINK